MKYSISAQQPSKILEQAEEIMVLYKDRMVLLDYIDSSLQSKDIVIAINNSTDIEIDFSFLDMINKKLNLTISVADLSISDILKQHNLKFYWGLPVTTYYDVRGLLDLGVSQIFITAPLTFDLKQLSEIVQNKAQIRMTANLAFPSYLLRKNGIEGSYVRPEDVKAYEPYVDILQFDEVTLGQERQLFEIYHNDQHWFGNLNLLIKNLGVDVDNRGFSDEWLRRLTCGQRCQIHQNCHLCQNIINYINAIDRAKFDWDIETHDWKNEEI